MSSTNQTQQNQPSNHNDDESLKEVIQLSSQQQQETESGQYTLFDKDLKEHKLQTKWTFWYDRKLKHIKGKSFEEKTALYRNNMKQINTFDTIENFLRTYQHMKRPSQLEVNTNYHLFRDEVTPLWENFKRGGCWILRMKKNNDLLDRIFEALIFSVIGEEFGEPDLVGVVISIRPMEDVLSLWTEDNYNQRSKMAIANKFRSILNLQKSVVIQYKTNRLAMKDGSNYRNARSYMIQENDQEQHNKEPETLQSN